MEGQTLEYGGTKNSYTSILTSISVYSMQMCWFPRGVCDAMDKASPSFLWSNDAQSKGAHNLQWDTVTAPKKIGGACDYNSALLGNLAWGMVCGKSKTWSEVPGHKYLKGQDLFHHSPPRNCSPTWKAIMRSPDDFFFLLLLLGMSSLNLSSTKKKKKFEPLFLYYEVKT